MEQRKYNVGDRVQMVIGGPPMLICNVETLSYCHSYKCKWFSKQDVLQVHSFKENELILYKIDTL